MSAKKRSTEGVWEPEKKSISRLWPFVPGLLFPGPVY